MIRHKFYLASTSPRRQELLAGMGIPFSVLSPGDDESVESNVSPQEMVRLLSKRKALAGVQMIDGDIPSVVLGADTVVAIDDHILGKPIDADDARRMLKLLSGRTHSVFTGVALAVAASNGAPSTCFITVMETKVTFRVMLPALIETYVATREPLDKAGGYGIQGGGSVFVIELLGDYFNVVGLPVSKVAAMLEQCGFDWWNPDCWLEGASSG
ncbi:MAG: Maf family protein [Chthonomonadales bacterium]